MESYRPSHGQLYRSNYSKEQLRGAVTAHACRLSFSTDFSGGGGYYFIGAQIVNDTLEKTDQVCISHFLDDKTDHMVGMCTDVLPWPISLEVALLTCSLAESVL